MPLPPAAYRLVRGFTQPYDEPQTSRKPDDELEGHVPIIEPPSTPQKSMRSNGRVSPRPGNRPTILVTATQLGPPSPSATAAPIPLSTVPPPAATPERRYRQRIYSNSRKPLQQTTILSSTSLLPSTNACGFNNEQQQHSQTKQLAYINAVALAPRPPSPSSSVTRPISNGYAKTGDRSNKYALH